MSNDEIKLSTYVEGEVKNIYIDTPAYRCLMTIADVMLRAGYDKSDITAIMDSACVDVMQGNDI